MNIPLKEFWYDWGGFNQRVFFEIYGLGVKQLDGLLPVLDFIGNYKHAPIVFIAALLLLLSKHLYLYLQERDVSRLTPRAYMAWATNAFLAFGLMALIVGGMKEYLDFARPYIALSDRVDLLYGPVEAKRNLASFPSGHVAFTTLWAALLWPRAGGFLRLILLLAVFSACWFRIAIGAHFPMDVLTSLIIGTFCAAIFRQKLRSMFRAVPWR